MSGWGEMDDMREDLFKDWGELLDKWDGKEKARPKQLIKLCRKVLQIHWTKLCLVTVTHAVDC